MSSFSAPLADIQFTLRHIGGLPDIAALPGLEHATPTWWRQCSTRRRSSRPTCWRRSTRPAIARARCWRTASCAPPAGSAKPIEAYIAGGWMGPVFPEAFGGQDLPWLVNAAVAEIWNAANLSFQLCPLLTQGAIEAILHHGTEAQKQLYATRLVSGQWTGAMCLTEPQAGSDVGALRTRAVRDGDQYRIFGTKIFITYGEHDLAENIVHLVLARLDGAPAGTKGISLFLVPKFLPGDDGSLGRRNDLRCVSLEHKLGIQASPTCVMAYGDDDGAVGFLLGEENQGMRCMFTMMNNARLAVGNEGLGLAERAYQQALAYARQRVQGTRTATPRPSSTIRTCAACCSACGRRSRRCAHSATGPPAIVDRSQRAAEPDQRRLAAERVALLTPMVKAWCTDLAQEITTSAVQVHGGMGFIEEAGAAQHFRDARILAIYEGTNGIQALDLVGRKLSMAGGELPWRLIDELRAELSAGPARAGGGARRAGAHDAASAGRHGRGSGCSRLGLSAPVRHGDRRVPAGARRARGMPMTARSAATTGPGSPRFYASAVLPPALALEPLILAGADLLDPALLPAA